jgi:beta-lactamase superfamily II metal-dependent hydrolase
MPKLIPPENGLVVRMYRIGHGDCFLIAAPREGGGDPVYTLIDCGYKPGSSSDEFLHGKSATDIVDHLRDACGNKLDLAIATHEHQDHLNAIWKKRGPYFGKIDIDETWLAWTEKPDDPLAKRLRKANHDRLLGLIAARNRLAAAFGAGSPDVRQIDLLLGLESGEDPDAFPTPEAIFAAADPANSVNKQGLKLLKDKAAAGRGVRYLYPGEGPLELPGTRVQVYVLGPPYSEELIEDEDPKGAEAFPDDRPHGFSLGAAARSESGGESPFANRFGIPFEEARSGGNEFFTVHYGVGDEGESSRDNAEVQDDAPFRRVDADWLLSATDLALAMAQGTNNTSLVLAFELPETKKVLLFVGDAQRGSWVSWADLKWTVDGAEVTTRDLFGRTVLYKVGHHGSHNATLNGTPQDAWPNLAWMANGSAAGEFAAMITAVNRWALEKAEWNHPLPSIKTALEQKTAGRLFQTDTDTLTKPADVTAAAWKTFTDRATVDDHYFDYIVLDRP